MSSTIYTIYTIHTLPNLGLVRKDDRYERLKKLFKDAILKIAALEEVVEGLKEVIEGLKGEMMELKRSYFTRNAVKPVMYEFGQSPDNVAGISNVS